MNRPQPEEFGIFYQKYIDKVSDDVLAELADQLDQFSEFIDAIPVEKADFAYAEGKWTVKELIGHVLDTERIMCYRMLRIGRGDTTPLPGFEENDYVANAHFADRSLASFAAEFRALRAANLYLFRSLNETELDRAGTASGCPISTRALLFIVAGHLNHHWKLLEERYLK